MVSVLVIDEFAGMEESCMNVEADWQGYNKPHNLLAGSAACQPLLDHALFESLSVESAQLGYLI